jgi:hypothetical protein
MASLVAVAGCGIDLVGTGNQAPGTDEDESQALSVAANARDVYDVGGSLNLLSLSLSGKSDQIGVEVAPTGVSGASALRKSIRLSVTGSPYNEKNSDGTTTQVDETYYNASATEPIIDLGEPDPDGFKTGQYYVTIHGVTTGYESATSNPLGLTRYEEWYTKYIDESTGMGIGSGAIKLSTHSGVLPYREILTFKDGLVIDSVATWDKTYDFIAYENGKTVQASPLVGSWVETASGGKLTESGIVKVVESNSWNDDKSSSDYGKGVWSERVYWADGTTSYQEVVFLGNGGGTVREEWKDGTVVEGVFSADAQGSKKYKTEKRLPKAVKIKLVIEEGAFTAGGGTLEIKEFSKENPSASDKPDKRKVIKITVRADGSEDIEEEEEDSAGKKGKKGVYRRTVTFKSRGGRQVERVGQVENVDRSKFSFSETTDDDTDLVTVTFVTTSVDGTEESTGEYKGKRGGIKDGHITIKGKKFTLEVEPDGKGKIKDEKTGKEVDLD